MMLQPIEPWPGDATPGGVNRLYTGQQAAAAVGLSWERFRKVRAVWTRDRDFPAELNEPGEHVFYLADAVDRWAMRRSRRVHAVPDLTPPPADPKQGQQRAAAEGRARLRQLKGAA